MRSFSFLHKKPNALSSAAAAHQLNSRCALPEATRSCSQPFLRAPRPSPTRAGPPFAATPQPSLLGQCGSRSAEPCSFFWSFSPSSGDCTEAPVSPEPCLLGLEDSFSVQSRAPDLPSTPSDPWPRGLQPRRQRQRQRENLFISLGDFLVCKMGKKERCGLFDIQTSALLEIIAPPRRSHLSMSSSLVTAVLHLLRGKLQITFVFSILYLFFPCKWSQFLDAFHFLNFHIS